MPDSHPAPGRRGTASDDPVVARLDAARTTYRSMRYRGPTPDFEAVHRPAWGLRWAPMAAGLAAASLALIVSLIVMKDTALRPQTPPTPPVIERVGSTGPVEATPPTLDPETMSVERSDETPVDAVEPTRPEIAISDQPPTSIEPVDAPSNPRLAPRWTGPSASAGLGAIHRGLGRPTAPARPLALTLRVPSRPRPTAPDTP